MRSDWPAKRWKARQSREIRRILALMFSQRVKRITIAGEQIHRHASLRQSDRPFLFKAIHKTDYPAHDSGAW